MNINLNVSLTQLYYFYTVVNSHSLHEAANKLLIAQPSLSVSLKNLERDLQLELFQRNKRQLILTETGKQFYEEVKHLLDHTHNLENRIKLLQKGHQFIRLGVPPMMSSFLFPLIFNQFKVQYPHIDFEIYEAGVLRLKILLKEQKLDLAFLIEDEQDKAYLSFTPLLKTAYYLYVGKSDPLIQLASNKPNNTITLNDYKNIPMIFYKETSYIQALITKYFQIHKINPQILLRTNQIHTIKQLTRSSLAAAFLTEKVVDPEDELIPIHTDISFPITIGLSTNKLTYTTPAMQTFISYFENNSNKL